MDYTDKPVFMFSPNWDEGVLERLEWLTDVLQSKTGAEQRISKRVTPRRGFEITLRIGNQDRQFFDNSMMTYQGSEWLMPLYHDVTRLTQAAGIGASVVYLDTTLREFVAGGYAIIKSQRAQIFEVVKINSVAADSLTLISNNVRAWPKGSYIYPASIGMIDGDMNLAKQTDTWMDINIKTTLTGTNDYTAAFPAVTYQGLPVLNVRPDESDDLSNTYGRMLAVLDGNLGKRRYFDTAGKTFIGQAYNWGVIGRAKAQELRSLIYALRGRQKPIWLPTFMQDFNLMRDIGVGDSVMTVANAGFSTVNVLQVNRQDVRIELHDGTVIFKRILAYAGIDDDKEAIGFDTPFDQDIAVGDVRMISFMGVFRLDNDSVEINHDTDTNGLTRVATIWKSNPAVRAAADWTPPPFPDTAMNAVTRTCGCECSNFDIVSAIDTRIAGLPTQAQGMDGLRAWAAASTWPQPGTQAAAEAALVDWQYQAGMYLGILLTISFASLVVPLWFSAEAWQTDLGTFPVNYEDTPTDAQKIQWDEDTKLFWVGFQTGPLYFAYLTQTWPKSTDSDGNTQFAGIGAEYFLPTRQSAGVPDSSPGVYSEACLQVIDGLQEQFSPVAEHHVSGFRGATSVYGGLLQYLYDTAFAAAGSGAFSGQITIPIGNPAGSLLPPGSLFVSVLSRAAGNFDADTIRPRNGAYLLMFSEFHESLQTGDVYSSGGIVITNPGSDLPVDTPHGPQPNFREIWVRGEIGCWVDDGPWPSQMRVNVQAVGSGKSSGSVVMDTISFRMPDGRYFIFAIHVNPNYHANSAYTGDPDYGVYEMMQGVGDTVVVQAVSLDGSGGGSGTSVIGDNADGSYYTNDAQSTHYKTPLAACEAYGTSGIMNLQATAAGPNGYVCSAQQVSDGQAITFGSITTRHE